jgi:transposase-like protein
MTLSRSDFRRSGIEQFLKMVETALQGGGDNAQLVINWLPQIRQELDDLIAETDAQLKSIAPKSDVGFRTLLEAWKRILEGARERLQSPHNVK